MSTHRLPEGTAFGPYTVEGLIGRGGMGQVYAARDSVYGTRVALKVLHPTLHSDEGWRTRFNQEGLVGTQLKHPHVLSARDLVENDGRIALVLDLVSGGQTLDRVIRREFKEGVDTVPALLVFLRILQGVEYLHRKGIVHGDIKPENILLEGNFRVPGTWIPRMTDFGTVALIAHPVEIDGRPAVVATPRYASPEHLLGVDHLEVRSDVYCLGLILHFLLTGSHASNASNVLQAFERTMLPVPIVALVDQPDPLIAVFQRATAREVDERFETARDLALAVRGVLEALGAPLQLEDVASELATEIDEARRAEYGLPKRSTTSDEESPVSTLTPGVQPIAPELDDPEAEPTPTEGTPRPISQAARASAGMEASEMEPVPMFVWAAGAVAALLIAVITVFAWPG
ncbi:MAG: serine/threonine protein kinase [Myxococcales bacterium]|nr:serine/threonine protein kinase [Myxococcales bacterium]